MPSPALDTSLTGYTSGSVDKQDEIYRNRQRPQPYPLIQKDSGYESATYLRSNSLPKSSTRSLLGVASSSHCGELLSNESNFAPSTSVECYRSDGISMKRQSLDEKGFLDCLDSSRADLRDEFSPRILLFFTTLKYAEHATYRAQSSLSKAVVEALISCYDLNLLFLPDLLARPNYWSAQLYSNNDTQGNLKSVDFFCQQPRFVIHKPNFKQRSPTSIYMRYDAVKNMTYYLIAAPESDECVTAFQVLLNLALHDDSEKAPGLAALCHPLEAHILLSKVLCESSHSYIHLFRQSMFAQLRAVDELSVQGTNTNRVGLTNVTIELQIISKDVNKLIGDVEVALRNLVKTQEAVGCLEDRDTQNTMHGRLPPSSLPLVSSASNSHDLRQQLTDTLQYLHDSMDKQMMWLRNYRDRKNIAMELVFNLVTQQDAANNINIATAMRRDSSSMNGIALLTMVFLPGTFTSTILGAGVFSAFAQHRDIHVSGLWWFWAAITFPLTGVVLIIWVMFCWRQELFARLASFQGKKKLTGSDDVGEKV